MRVPAESDQRFTRPLEGTRFLITSAQNATPVDAKFFETLKRAADHLNATLVVVPLRYKNPTSQWTTKQEADDWWDEAVMPYLHNTRKKLCANLVLAADVRTQPTAVSPLSGFEALTGAESCIVAHPKMQLRSVPVPSGAYPKILTTTGACTRRNYSPTKAGALGKFHHFLGAIIVETKGKKFQIRQLNADRETGSFIDKDLLFEADKVSKAPRAEALCLGDTHAVFADKTVDAATFGEGGIVETLNPRRLVWHDVLDGYAVNPHHTHNPFIARAKWAAAMNDVETEVKKTVAYVAERTKGDVESFIVASNHNDFLNRWLRNQDWRFDPENAEFYLETALAVVRSAKMGKGGAEYADAFGHWVERLKGSANVKCLGQHEGLLIAGIECGLHGDKGPNGARGTLRNLARVGRRVNTGHSHSPGIEEGHYQGGTSTPLSLEYTGPIGSWLNTHTVIYSNGKRSLLNIIEGEWCL